MVEIRQAMPADEPSIKDYLHEFYGDRASTKYPARWKWQFTDNPFAPASGLPVALAMDGGRVVGQLGLQFCPLWLAGQETRAAWGVDFGVLASYRGQGIGTRLQTFGAQLAPRCLSAVMDDAAARIKERLRFHAGPPIQRFRRFGRIGGSDILLYAEAKAATRGRVFQTLVEWGGRRLRGAAIAASILRAIIPLQRTFRGIEKYDGPPIEEFDAFGPETDALWEAARGEYRMTTARTARYLNWRYVACPGLVYRKFRSVRSGAMEGYAVVRQRSAPEQPSLRIVDIFCRRGDAATAGRLVAHVVHCFGDRVPFLETACSNPDLATAIRRAGFVATGSQFPWASEGSGSPKGPSTDLTGWSITMGDQDWDQFRPLPGVKCSPCAS